MQTMKKNEVESSQQSPVLGCRLLLLDLTPAMSDVDSIQL